MFFWLCLLTFVVFLWVLKRIIRNYSFLREIPMPNCNILVGHAFDLSAKGSLNTFSYFAARCGRLIRVYIPPNLPTVIVTEARLIQALTTSENAIEKSKDYDFVKRWLGQGLLSADGYFWRPSRRILTPCFGRLSLMMNFVRIFESNGDELIETFKNEIENTSIDVFPLAKEFTMNVMCESSMGISKLHNDHKNKYFRCIDELQQITLNRVFSMFKRFDCFFRFSNDYKREKEAFKSVEELFHVVMDEKMKHINAETEEGSAPTFLDMLLQCEAKNKINKECVRDQLNTFLFGGHDTTATGLSFTLYALSRNPEIQDKILEEQNHIFGGINRDREVSYSDLTRMKYLEMVIHESLRMYPPIPIISRRVTKEFDLGKGIFLPKKQNIGIFIYGCHYDPEYFPEPHKFIPERFQKDITPCSFIPFSNGPRNCIGKKFALLQMKSCIAKVVRNFKILPPKPDYEIDISSRMTLCSRNGIRISLEKRAFPEE